MSNKYKFRKEIIKKIIGFSTKIDDNLEGLKQETLVLIIKFCIVIMALGLIIYASIVQNYVQIVIFSIILLSSFLSYLNQIKKYRITKALVEVKELRKKLE